MAKFIKGDVVVIPFPFSDLTQTKRRPAYAIPLEDKDFKAGELKQSSNVRPNRIFTADSHIILYKAGSLTVNRLNEVIDKIVEIIRK